MVVAEACIDIYLRLYKVWILDLQSGDAKSPQGTDIDFSSCLGANWLQSIGKKTSRFRLNVTSVILVLGVGVIATV